MKRILIFCLAYKPFWGGAELAVKEITDRLPPADFEFHMITLRMNRTLPKEERVGNIVIHRIGVGGRFGKASFQFHAACKGILLQRKKPFDGAWAVMAHSSGVPATLFAMFYPRVPYVLTLQEGDPPEYIERLMRPLWPLFSRAFKRASIIQAISTYLGAWARRRGFEGPLQIIPNGVDTERFGRISPPERTALRRAIGAHESDLLIVTTSRLVRKNGIDTLIRALSLLSSSVHLAIVGEGPEHEALALLAKELSVSERVRFCGAVAYERIPSYLHAADLFARPSRSEGMGTSFIEAMAAGLPVVGTQVGGITDFLFDPDRNPGRESTGFAVDIDDPESMAEVIKRIASDRSAADRIALNAKRFVSHRYDWNTIVREMRENVFDRL